MTYDEIYNKLEEFCNSITPEEYDASYEWEEMDNIVTELEEFLKKNHEDLFWELVDHGDELLNDPWKFLEDFPTERAYIIYLLEYIDSLTIAEWTGFEIDRNKLIDEYLASHI